MFDPNRPDDPTQPRDPVLLPRRAPAPVRLAVLFMVAGAVLGLVSATALFLASAAVPAGFRNNLHSSDATPADIDSIATVIRTAFLAAGVMSLVLALAVAVAAVGVRRGRNVARIGALALIAAALCCGLGSASYTSLGRGANWTVNVDDTSDQLAREVGQAYSDAMPAALAGATGGLTDLQSLGYIAVVVLLLVPVSHAYFRRRPGPPGPGGSAGPDSSM